MNIMTVETSDAVAFKKATNYLKKLNVKINVVEQDVNATMSVANDDDDFETEWAKSIPADEVFARLKQNMRKHFNEKGENIHLLNKNKG